MKSRKKRLVRIAMVLVFGLLIWQFAPVTIVYYRSVKDSAASNAPWARYIEVKGVVLPYLLRSGDFRIEHHELLLRVRKVIVVEPLMAVLVKNDVAWHEKDLRILAEEHRGLADYWPNTNTANYGVAWVLP